MNTHPLTPRPSSGVSKSYELVMAIVDAACEHRDADWNQDQSAVVDRLEAAVDAWREYLRKRGRYWPERSIAAEPE